MQGVAEDMSMRCRARDATAAALWAVLVFCARCPALGFSPAVSQLRVPGLQSFGARSAVVCKSHFGEVATRKSHFGAVAKLRAAAEPMGDIPAFAAPDAGNKPTRHFAAGSDDVKPFRIVLIAGFEVRNDMPMYETVTTLQQGGVLRA